RRAAPAIAGPFPPVAAGPNIVLRPPAPSATQLIAGTAIDGHVMAMSTSQPFVVEIWGEPAGYLEEEGNSFRFHALVPPFFTLDGAHFAKPGHARLAAAQLAGQDARRGGSATCR